MGQGWPWVSQWWEGDAVAGALFDVLVPQTGQVTVVMPRLGMR